MMLESKLNNKPIAGMLKHHTMYVLNSGTHSHQKSCSRRRCHHYSGTWIVLFAILLLTSALSMIPQKVAAQSGKIIGVVTDAGTGEVLAGARLTLTGADITAITDDYGRFVFRQIPSGSHTLTVRFLGYEQLEIQVTADSDNEYHIQLADQFVPGDRIYISGRQAEQSRALTRQWESENFSTVISSEQLNRFDDYTVEQAVSRVPGFQAGRYGDLNFRGTGYGMFNVKMNGMRMPSTGMGNRSVDLGGISSDLIREIEVVRVLTPDMDADALGGAVNLRTRRKAGYDRQLSASTGGAFSSRYGNFVSPGGQGYLKYAEQLRDDFSLSLFVSRQQNSHAWESLGIQYDTADFGSGAVDVLESLTPMVFTDSRNRTGGGLEMTFQPSSRTSYYLLTVLNNDKRLGSGHLTTFSANGDWIDPTATGMQGGRGSMRYDIQTDDIHLRNYFVQTGGKHIFDRFDLDYNAGWGLGSVLHEYIQIPFSTGGLDYAINMTDRSRPYMMNTSDPVRSHDLQVTELFDEVIQEHVENTFSGNLNVTIPHILGSLKVGGSAQLALKDGDYRRSRYRYLGILRLSTFDILDGGSFSVMDDEHYDISWPARPGPARSFVVNNIPVLRLERTLQRLESDHWNYEVNEHVYAGYGMTTLEFGNLTLLGGARLEHTLGQRTGREVIFGSTGGHNSTTDTTRQASYTNIFPNAQLIFDTGSLSSVRIAYSRSIQRPDYNISVPFIVEHRQNQTLFKGNPDLRPIISDNLDFLLESYFFNIGHFGLGAFYKSMSNFVAGTTRLIDDGPFEGWEETTFINDDAEATIYGAEISWQQNLTFLPGFLSNIGTYANYTWSQSTYKIRFREDEVDLPGQSPHVVNAALNYSQGRFSGQVAYHWTATALVQLAQLRVTAPSIPGTNVYLDHYEDGANDMSASVRFRITDNFRLWLAASNLLGSERYRYAHTRDYYPLAIDSRAGREIRMGVRFDL